MRIIPFHAYKNVEQSIHASFILLDLSYACHHCGKLFRRYPKYSPGFFELYLFIFDICNLFNKYLSHFIHSIY